MASHEPPGGNKWLLCVYRKVTRSQLKHLSIYLREQTSERVWSWPSHRQKKEGLLQESTIVM